MKTAEEIVLYIQTGKINQYQARSIIRDYAKQLAEQALKDAAEGIKPQNDKFSSLHRDLSKIILSTPIVTP